MDSKQMIWAALVGQGKWRLLDSDRILEPIQLQAEIFFNLKLLLTMFMHVPTLVDIVRRLWVSEWRSECCGSLSRWIIDK